MRACCAAVWPCVKLPSSSSGVNSERPDGRTRRAARSFAFASSVQHARSTALSGLGVCVFGHVGNVGLSRARRVFACVLCSGVVHELGSSVCVCVCVLFGKRMRVDAHTPNRINIHTRDACHQCASELCMSVCVWSLAAFFSREYARSKRSSWPAIVCVSV